MANPDTYTLALGPEIGLRTAGQLLEQLRTALSSHQAVIIDAAAVTAIDISAIQLLVSARKTAIAAGKALSLRAAPSGVLRDTLRKAGFIDADGRSLTPEGDFWSAPTQA